MSEQKNKKENGIWTKKIQVITQVAIKATKAAIVAEREEETLIEDERTAQQTTRASGPSIWLEGTR